MYFLIPGFVLLCVYVAPAVKIVNVTLFTEELVVSSPSRLLVPCRFYTNESIASNQLLLEWAMTPENKEDCIPILRLFDTLWEPLPSSNKRAQVFVSQFPKGNCSLVINPTCPSDSGIYEARVYSDGVQYVPAPIVKIQVLEDKKSSDVVDDCKSMDVADVKGDNVDKDDNETVSPIIDVEEKKLDGFTCEECDPKIFAFIQMLQKLQKDRRLKLLFFGGIVILCVLCLCFVLTLGLGIRYCFLKFKSSKNGSVKDDVEEAAIEKPDEAAREKPDKAAREKPDKAAREKPDKAAREKPDKAEAEMKGKTNDGDDGKHVDNGIYMLPSPPPEMSSSFEFKPYVDDLLPA